MNGARAKTHVGDLRQRLNYDLRGHPNQQVAITAYGDVVGMSNQVPMVNGHMRSPSKGSPTRRGSSDLLSVLLARGTELRQAMVVSSLNAQDQQSNIKSSASPTKVTKYGNCIIECQIIIELHLQQYYSYKTL